ncbi:MAG: LysR family transcriptional regulator [Massilia sp.]|jgi:DNA-binding transcriptional LysR family regulator|nr:LysR family transcriptional regulator [Massilia sp.]
MSRKLDTHLLEIFVCVVDKKSLTHAGIALNLVVSAISKRIQELERHVGKALFKRNGRGIAPTAAGDLLYLHARSILRSLRAADEALIEFGNNGIKKIRLLANQTTIVQSLPPQLASYLATAQATSVELIEGHSVDIPARVCDGDADVGIYHAQYPSAGVVSYPYRRDRIGLVVPTAHPLTARKSIAFEEALDFPLVGGFPRHSLDLFLELAGDSLSRPPNVVFSVSNFEARCHMVKEGAGIAMLPEDIAHRYIDHLGLSLIRINDAWAERQFFGCVRESDAANTVAGGLLAHLCAGHDNAAAARQ